MGASSGTVTFLFTDIQGSTRLWQLDEAAMRAAVARHDAIVQSTIAALDGSVFSTMGDGVAAVFPSAPSAITAAQELQVQLHGEVWPTAEPVRVRIGLHSGEADVRDGDYFGTAVNRAARIMGIAHGGQVLCSGATQALVASSLPPGAALVDLGTHRLRDLSAPEQIHQLVIEGLDCNFPRLRSLESLPGNLPVQPTAFVGRDRDVKELVETILSSRLVTLTGVGGVGKTRLALQAAAELLPSFTDGAWLVELAGVGSADAVHDTVAAALNLPVGGPSGPGGLLELLRPKQLLLVLDNCEHLLSPVADLVDDLVHSAPGVRILATSREGLGVAGERLRTVTSMELPEAEEEPATIMATDSVRLFVERAREASAAYGPSDEDAVVVAELCRRLDGIPLAIELAAARVPALTPAEIAAHLDRRFKLLTGGRRSALPRHQTLRNAIGWSYQLLEPQEQMVLDRLSVFAGDFDLGAAQAVASSEEVDDIEVLDLLARLVAKSLVVAEPHGSTTRYRLLETIRDFTWEHLTERGEADARARKHAEHYAAFAKVAGVGLRGADEPVWRERLELELDNLRAALSWAIATGETQLALRSVADLSLFGDRVTVYGLLAEPAARSDPDNPLAAVAFAAATFAAGLRGDYEKSQHLADEAWRIADALGRSPEELWVRCRVANGTCMTMSVRGSWSEFGRQWLADARELGDAWNLCEALTFGISLPDVVEAVSNGEEALVLARELGSPSRVAFAAVLLAGRVGEIDPARAEALLVESTEAAMLARNDWAEFTAAPAMSMAKLRAGNQRAAAETLVESAENWAARGFSGAVIQFMAYLAPVLYGTGDHEGGLVLAEWSEGRGVRLPADNATVAPLKVGDLQTAREVLSSSDVGDIVRTANNLDESAVLVFARSRLAKLDDITP